MPTSSALSAFALDPGAYLPARPGATVVDDPRFRLTVSSDGTRASVCRLRTDDVAVVFRDVTAHAHQAGKMSKPILQRLGFRSVCEVHILVDSTA